MHGAGDDEPGACLLAAVLEGIEVHVLWFQISAASTILLAGLPGLLSSVDCW
jgi:hypothetical protein